MASLAWSDYLRTAFGVDTSAVDESSLQRLIDDAVPERDVLDFKGEPYAATDRDRLELALDVAALANATGGMILVGIHENTDSTAASFAALASGTRDTEERRVREIVAQRVFPIPAMDVEWVPVQDGGVLVIVVPPSPTAPHAVPRSGAPTERFLCWPRRDGTRKRYLTEPEVADGYSTRARRSRGSFTRVADAAAELERAVEREDDRRWLTATLVPSQPGAIRVADWDRASVRRNILQPIASLPPEQRFLVHHDVEVVPALRRVRLAGQRRIPTKFWLAELHVDGAAACGDPVSSLTEWWSQDPYRQGPAPTVTRLPEEWVFQSLRRALGAVVHLSGRVAGGRGTESILRLSLRAAGGQVGRFDNFGRWQPEHIVEENLELNVSVDLDRALSHDGYRGLLGLVATDLWNGLGFTTCRYIDLNGTLAPSARELFDGYS